VGKTLPQSSFPFCSGSNLGYYPVLDAQRSINLFFEPNLQGSKSGYGLIGTPGSVAVLNLPKAPVRGLFGGNNTLYAVSGSHVYQIDPNALAVHIDFGAIPGSGGVDPYGQYKICKFRGNGTQLLMFDPSVSQIFQLDPLAPAINAEFNAMAMEYLDGFFVALATGASLATANPNQISTSAFGNGTSWPALAFTTNLGSADQVNQLAVVNELLWVFGTQNTSIWYNAGTAPFPFAKVVSGGTLNVGCMAPLSVANIANSVMWLGSSDRGWGRVYLAEGLQPIPVSTPAIEQILNAGITANPSMTTTISAFSYEEGGHSFYVLNLPSINYSPAGIANGWTIAYDISTKLWHERAFWNGSALSMAYPICFGSVQWAPTGWGTNNFAGSFGTGDVMTFSQLNTKDTVGGVTFPIRRIRTAPHVSDGNRWIKYPFFELDANIGSATPFIDYSNDGGRSFPLPTGGARTLLNGGTDQGGAFVRYKGWQFGRSRDRVFRVTITDQTNQIALVNAYCGAGAGTEE